MDTINCGMFDYSDLLNQQQINTLPTSLRLKALNEEALLVRLLTGNIEVKRALYVNCSLRTRKNYMSLPTERYEFDPTNAIKRALSLDISRPDVALSLDQYFVKNHKNHNIFKNLLNEITQFFFYEKKSPSAAFVHLYRSVEQIAYCFPLMYTLLTKDYEKSFIALRGFLIDKNANQLSFFKKFLEVLFQNDTYIQAFTFEIIIFGSQQTQIMRDFLRIAVDAKINTDAKTNLVNDNGIGKISFPNFVELFIAIRNRYFHMSVGSYQDNIYALDYDIEDLFRSINNVAINWFAVILSSIIYSGFLYL